LRVGGKGKTHLVGREGHVSTEHHEALVGLVFKLRRAVPLALTPLLVEEKTCKANKVELRNRGGGREKRRTVVLVGETDRGERPGSVEAGTVDVAASESVSACKEKEGEEGEEGRRRG
jgi:hypothetical protein